MICGAPVAGASVCGYVRVWPNAVLIPPVVTQVTCIRFAKRQRAIVMRPRDGRIR